MADKYIPIIYDKIFHNISYKQFDIFLCGGASYRNKRTGEQHKSKRDEIRDSLEVSTRNIYNILYPEDLFMELLNRKEYDLLTMENVLVDNCDVVLIIPESPGSFAELGAFVNNQGTAQKLLILQQEKFKRHNSFIAQGPVSYMAKQYPDSVVYFNSDFPKASAKVYKYLNRKFGNGLSIPFKDIDQLTGMAYFEVLILFFYESFNNRNLLDVIKDCYRKCVQRKGNDLDETYEDVLSRASVKYLFKNAWIEKIGTDYCLTKAGLNKAHQILDMFATDKGNHDIDGLRLSILHEKLSIS